MSSIFVLLTFLGHLIFADNNVQTEFFHAGKEEFSKLKNITVNASPECSMTEASHRIYCIQGFYFAKSSHYLEKNKKNIGKNLSSFYDSQLPTQSQFQSAFSLTLGMFFSYHKIQPTQFFEVVQQASKKLQENFIDGWAFAQYQQYGYEDSRAQCQTFKYRHLKEPCFWGLGRGFYYTGYPAGNHLRFNKNFVSGYMFARNLARKDGEKSQRTDAKAGELIKNLFRKKGPTEKKHQAFYSCLETSHIYECHKKLY